MLGWLVRVQQKRRATYRFKVIGSSGNCSEIRFFVVAWREGCERRVHWIIEKENRLRNESGSGCLTGFPGECHSNSNTIQDFTSPFFGGTHSTRPQLLATSVSQSFSHVAPSLSADQWRDTPSPSESHPISWPIFWMTTMCRWIAVSRATTMGYTGIMARRRDV